MRLLSIVLLCFIGWGVHAQQSIQGRISNDGKPLSPVHVVNLMSGDKTTSNSEGWYQILARPKEELQFTFMGMDTIKIITEDVTRILNIHMEPRVEELDGVTVSDKRTKTYQEKLLEFHSNKGIIRTSFGFLDTEKTGYRVGLLDKESISQGAIGLADAIRGRIAGVRVEPISQPPYYRIYLRQLGTLGNGAKTSVSYDVDGLVYNEYPDWLAAADIERIAVLSGLSATIRYGSVGQAGIIVVNTRMNNPYPADANGKPYDQARLRNNIYDRKALKNEAIADNYPQYLRDLKAAKNKEEANSVYRDYASKYNRSYPFVLESYRYFVNTWNDQEFADQLLQQFNSMFADDPVALKAFAYVLEEERKSKQAHETYKQIYKLRPDYAQSFIDLANSYRNVGMPESAATLYARHAYLQDEGMLPKDTVDLSKIMKRELNNIFALDNGTLKIKSRVKTEDDDFSTRLVFEWNDSEAEFELQFVNPGNQYYKWKHTLEDMSDRIRSEKELGYSMADFLMDDELPGVWQINAAYHGNKQLTPTYIKVTIYRNFGSKLQRKEVKVFQLGLKGSNLHLFNLNLPSQVVQSK